MFVELKFVWDWDCLGRRFGDLIKFKEVLGFEI